MSLCEVHWKSAVLGQHVAMNVLLPDTGTPPFPTLYLLHGLSDDHTGWLRKTRIEMYATAYPMIVVMPQGFRGFYTNNENGPAYATYIADELRTYVERNFPARAARDSRAIGGLSMGGYGALRLALGYPHLFTSAHSHSGPLRSGERLGPREGGPFSLEEFHRVFGTNPVGSDHDLTELARRAKAAGTLPKIRIDCGVEDVQIADNRAFHAELEQLGVPHDYEEFPGGHTWDYWDLHVREALAFHADALVPSPLAGEG
jgi:putative tributyrin esterase